MEQRQTPLFLDTRRKRKSLARNAELFCTTGISVSYQLRLRRSRSSTLNLPPVLHQILKLGCSILFCLVIGIVSGQDQEENEEDTVQVTVKKPDSLREKIYPRAFRLGTDVLALILSRTTSKYNGWEVNADVDFGPFYLAAEYGGSSRDETVASGGSYHNQGTYWRAGADINLLKKDPDRNMFFIGFRYGQASFNETLNFVSTDPYFGSLSYQIANPAASAGWGELTTGLRIKVFNEFWMGYTARMKFAASVSGNENLGTYDVPGFGVVGQGITWGFNYQLMWRIRFAKLKKP